MSRNVAKGTAAETAVVRALRLMWPMAERRAKTGSQDRGDIGGVVPGLVVEVKNCARLEIAEWLKEVDAETDNAGADLGVCWFKLRGYADPLDWPVMMRGRFFIPLLERWANG
jgi:hypothetical protein